MIPAALAWEEFKDMNLCSGWRWGMITKAMKKLQTSPRDAWIRRYEIKGTM
jgi:hypothetical protein